MKNLIFCLAVFVSFQCKAQTYFQQKIDFKIDVWLDTLKHSLRGYEKITYYNNSPDTLKFIYFHLYPNATRKQNKTALAKQKIYNNNLSLFFSDKKNLGFIDSLDFLVENEKANFQILKDSIDIGILYLNKPLLPGQNIQIETPFYVQIPYAGLTRMGYVSNFYGITQWYPKPAVYDNKGWHPYPYLDEGEFYSEFGSYDVVIHIPDFYTVAATGKLQNDAEWNRIEQIIKLSEQDYDDISYYYHALNKNLKGTYKTLRFIQDSVHDFAWFASPYFLINHDVAIIENRKLNLWSYYLPINREKWKLASKYIKQAVEYYSNNVGPYLYDHCTAVDCPITSGGMEYPMIAAIGWVDDEYMLSEVILHEVGHNWFYGMLASNERDNPWIDEGINTFYEKMFFKHDFRYLKNDWGKLFNLLNQYIFPNTIAIDYFYFSGNASPIGLKSEKFENSLSYYFNAYYNTSSIWYNMLQYLSKDTFELAMKNLYKKKSLQHVNPDDIKSAISEITSKSTDWFFKYYLYSNKRSDYKILRLNHYNNNLSLEINNNQKADFPFVLSLYNKDSLVFNKVMVGFSGLKKITLDSLAKKKFTKAVINDYKQEGYFIEKRYGNNTFFNRRFFPRLKGPSFRFMGIFDKPDKFDILYVPIPAFNKQDHSMLGLLLYAPLIPFPDFQFRLLPMYSFSKNKLTGSYLAEKNIPINSTLRYVKTSLFYQTYSLPNNDYQNRWQSLQWKLELPFVFYSNLKKTKLTYNAKITYASLPFYPYSEQWYVNQNFKLDMKFDIYVSNIQLNSENHHNYAKLKLKSHLFFPYNAKLKGIDLDYFFGTFIYNKSNYYLYNFFLCGINGIKDYLYDDVFIDRFTNIYEHHFWGQQFIMDDGMFSTYNPIQSNHWMTSIRGSVALPIPPPFYLYGTLGTYYGAKTEWMGSKKYPWEVGFEIRIIKNIFAIYFPITMSNDIKRLSDNYANNYFNKVRFMLRLSLLNPFKFNTEILSLLE